MSRSRYRWIVDLLVDELTAIEARELHLASIAAVTPARKDATNALKRLERIYTVRMPKPRPRVIEYNPDKAAEWFAARGIAVIRKPKGE